MSKKLLMVGMASALAVTACVSTMKNTERTAASEARSISSTGPNPLSINEILASSSSGKLGLANARLITDNDEAFNTKLAIVQNAKDNLYLTYYIYANDYSSSLFNAALIKKARSGTKIKIMVDLTTNYSRMDLFRMLEYAGGGNIEVRFYNKPSRGIQKIALYAVVGCSPANLKSANKSACDNEKKQKVAMIEQGAAAGNQDAMRAIGLSRVFLSAFYGKSKNAAIASVVGGQGIDVAYAKNLLEQSKAQKSNISGLVKSGNRYRMTGSISDGLAASNFNKALGDLVGEDINFATGVLPLNEINKDPQLKKDFDHWTDYTHQKLILGDMGGGKFNFETGGRNIEDSYHLKTTYLKDLKGEQKYLFKDTDFYGEVSSGGDAIAKAFLQNWNFSEMVATSSEMDSLAPFDAQLALRGCDSSAPTFNQCAMQILSNPDALKAKAVERVKAEVANMEQKSAVFMNKYLTPSMKLAASTKFSIRGNGQSDAISANDLRNSTITFIENLHYNKDAQNPVRTYGTASGNEAQDGRYISDLWLKGLENACASEKPQQIILHTAYLMPASNMVRVLGKMLDGTWDCRNVQIKIITNSFETTDLNVINILAQSQMQAIFQRNASSTSLGKASLHYYEYVRPQGQGQSLHTKLSVLGDDMIVGSANADVRSYYMDANTGVYVHNAPELTADYARYINGLVQDGTIVDKTSTFGSVVNGKMVFTNYRVTVQKLTEAVVDYWIGRSSIAQKESIDKAMVKYGKNKAMAVKFTDSLANEIYAATNTIMNPPTDMDSVRVASSAIDKCVKDTKADANVMKQIKRDIRDNDDYSSMDPNRAVTLILNNHCEDSLKQEKVQSVDPGFNLKFGMF
ncbi:MAG: hypothetical protein H7256_11110 [Bdellovibrio sp.]|nr:hypothetical protein [Bdellovibrio sp.]